MQKDVIEHVLRDVGFYSWLIQENKIFADRSFARFYELDDEELMKGVAVERILSMIVEEDRERLAERIHNVLLGGPPAVSPYRIICPSGISKSLTSIGSCSMDENGLPIMYSGIVMESNESDADPTGTQLSCLISAAISLAKNSGNALTERYLNSALRTVTPL